MPHVLQDNIQPWVLYERCEQRGHGRGNYHCMISQDTNNEELYLDIPLITACGSKTSSRLHRHRNRGGWGGGIYKPGKRGCGKNSKELQCQ